MHPLIGGRRYALVIWCLGLSPSPVSAHNDAKGCGPSPDPADIEQLLDEADARYDIAAAKRIMRIVKEVCDPEGYRYHYYMARSYEIISTATDAIKNDRTRGDEVFAVKALSHVVRAMAVAPSHSDSYRLYSEMLARRIYGPSTGMKYDAAAMGALKRALALDPCNFRALLRRAVNRLERPTGYGGDPEDGLRILEALHRRRPDHSRVLYYISYYYKIKGDVPKQRRYLEQALRVNPEERKAQWEKRELEIQDRRLTIGKLTLRNETKTSSRLIRQRLRPFIGHVYDGEVKSEIAERLTSLQTIDGVTFFYTVEDDRLVIDCAVSEDHLVVMNALLGGFISLDYDKGVNWFLGEAPSAIFGTLYYETNNFLGSGDRFSLATMVVYNDVRYQHYAKILDTRLWLEADLLPAPRNWYRRGRLIRPTPYESISLSGAMGVGKSFDFFLDLFLMQEVKKEFYTKTRRDFRAPAEAVTATTYLDITLDTITYRDNLWIMDGYLLELKPGLVVKPGYERWGDPGRPFAHDRRSMFRLYAHFGLFKQIRDQVQLRVDLFYLLGRNSYRLELFKVGKGASMDPFGMKLRGFYQEEFLVGHAVIANSSLSFPIVPKRARTGFFYDNGVLIEAADQATVSYKHGVGSRLMLRFPWDLELTVQCAFGLNADRRRLPGVEIDFYFSRLFVL